MCLERCQKVSITDKLSLTPTEIDIVRRTWKLANRPGNNLGKTLIIGLLQQVPKLRAHFGVSSNVDLDEVDQNPQLIVMTARFHQFLNAAVEALNANCNEELYLLARNVGIRHFHRGVNLEAMNWLFVKDILVSEMSKYHLQAAEKSNPIRKLNSLTRAYFKKRHSPVSQCQLLLASTSLTNDGGAVARRMSVAAVLPSELLSQMNETRVAWYKFMTLVIREMKRGLRSETLDCYRQQSGEDG